MENQKAKREEIRGKMLQAKTVEELLAIATEAGEPLTTEDATKLLQELEAERARVEDDFASAEDLSDEELAKVAGGAKVTYDIGTILPISEMTTRDGKNVRIYFSSKSKICNHWNCPTHWTGNTSLVSDYSDSDETVVTKRCMYCGIEARCSNCGFRRATGGVTRDFCSSPDVRRWHGV